MKTLKYAYYSLIDDEKLYENTILNINDIKLYKCNEINDCELYLNVCVDELKIIYHSIDHYSNFEFEEYLNI